jgi:hypothetical protein
MVVTRRGGIVLQRVGDAEHAAPSLSQPTKTTMRPRLPLGGRAQPQPSWRGWLLARRWRWAAGWSARLTLTSAGSGFAPADAAPLEVAAGGLLVLGTDQQAHATLPR